MNSLTTSAASPPRHLEADVSFARNGERKYLRVDIPEAISIRTMQRETERVRISSEEHRKNIYQRTGRISTIASSNKTRVAKAEAQSEKGCPEE